MRLRVSRLPQSQLIRLSSFIVQMECVVYDAKNVVYMYKIKIILFMLKLRVGLRYSPYEV